MHTVGYDGSQLLFSLSSGDGGAVLRGETDGLVGVGTRGVAGGPGTVGWPVPVVGGLVDGVVSADDGGVVAVGAEALGAWAVGGPGVSGGWVGWAQA